MTRILFLDIDGVLNPIPMRSLPRTDWHLAYRLAKEKQDAGYQHLSHTALSCAYYCWDVHAMELLKELCEQFQLQIIITSSWGSFYSLKELKLLFGLYALDVYLIAIVPSIGKRSSNILHFVKEHPEIEAWISIDDLMMEDCFPNHAVTTRGYLKDTDIEKAKTLLKQQLH